MINLVFIGDRFYKESKTMMSSVYRENPKGTFYRYDWGFMYMDMESGKELHIRPATKREIEFFEMVLNEMYIKYGDQRAMVVDVPDFFEFVLPDIGKPLVIPEPHEINVEQTANKHHCEHEQVHKTHCYDTSVSDRRDYSTYDNFTCDLLWCSHPDRDCMVKKQGNNV